MQIQYVVSTMVFWWREHHLSFEMECDYLRSLGYGIELWPTIKGHNECRFSRRNWSRLKEATEGMTVALNSRNDGPTLNEWAEQIECAKELNAPIVADPESLCISSDLGIADWTFAKDVMQIADEKGVQICLENGPLPVVLQAGEKLETIKFCIDTGHAYIDRKHTFREYADQLAERTVYLHLTDNYGEYDDHEPPGVRGGMPRENWDYLIEKISLYDNNVIGSLEMFPCMPGTMIKKSSKFLFDFLKWPNPPEKQPGIDEWNYQPM